MPILNADKPVVGTPCLKISVCLEPSEKKKKKKEPFWPWADSSANYTITSHTLYANKYSSVNHFSYKGV